METLISVWVNYPVLVSLFLICAWTSVPIMFRDFDWENLFDSPQKPFLFLVFLILSLVPVLNVVIAYYQYRQQPVHVYPDGTYIGFHFIREVDALKKEISSGLLYFDKQTKTLNTGGIGTKQNENTISFRFDHLLIGDIMPKFNPLYWYFAIRTNTW